MKYSLNKSLHKKSEKLPILIAGAGTGLGKALLIYNEKLKSYVPMPSEAGHVDFMPQDASELELFEFIKRRRKMRDVSYEDVLSGRGIENIYFFLKKKIMSKQWREIENSRDIPASISKYRKSDHACRIVFEIFAMFYARFIRNMALDCLPYGGIFICGGIAQKNADIFNKAFKKEYMRNSIMKSLLARFPIFLVTDEKIGLRGAAFFAGEM